MHDSHQGTDVQTASGIAEKELSAIQISGPDRLIFLQGQLTQDLDLLAPEQALLTGWTTVKGRLECTSWLLDWQTSVWMIVPTELRDAIARRLQMYVLRADVQIEQPDIVVQAVATEPQAGSNYSSISCCFDDDYYTIQTDPGWLLKIGGSVGGAAVQSSLDGWRFANIRQGIPTIWAETRGSFVPQMVNLDLLNGISFTKGCFVGQEIIARTQNLGRIKRRMYRFQCSSNSSAEPGSPVYAGAKIVGEVVDAIASAEHSELLAVVRTAAASQPLSLGDKGEYPLTIKGLPYSIETSD
jgi:folate-binding protein YgfZ